MYININLINSLNLEVFFWGKKINLFGVRFNLFGIPIKSYPKKNIDYFYNFNAKTLSLSRTTIYSTID